ncbi:MAG: diadenylate cyclase [Clostridiales bacterium]|nr:diadenylate cyclase [Clostridiales bacterium]
MGNSDFITQIIKFINELFHSLNSGYLFFGNGWDFIRYVIDIVVVTMLFYWIFMFVRQTRAWQLIKGIVLVLLFVFFCSIIGMDMVSFLFNRLLYVFAILFIILFQPELRRVLETVGIRTSGQVKGIFIKKANDANADQTKAIIKEICDACGAMSASYTGALILIERNTKLNELAEQENAVHFESTVTSSVLQSIFYKGSPMHDGALLIREGVIIAARCHVPLSVTMHELEKSGTRHRAAVGASELGDTVVVVVSEERGTISVAVNGRLFEMSSAEELKANLSYLLGVAAPVSHKKGAHGKKKGGNAMPKTTQVEAGGIQPQTMEVLTRDAADIKGLQKVSNGQKVFFFIISLVLSLTLWLYIQVQNNPVVTRTITVPIQYETENMPQGIDASRPVKTCELTIVGRQNAIGNISPSDVKAYIDYEQLDVKSSGVYKLDVKTESVLGRYFRVERQLPENVSVTVYSVN